MGVWYKGRFLKAAAENRGLSFLLSSPADRDREASPAPVSRGRYARST